MRIDTALADRIRHTDEDYLALGHAVIDFKVAELVQDRRCPGIRDANHLRRVRANTTAKVDELLAMMEEKMEGLPHRRILGPFPPELEARLMQEDWTQDGGHLLVLDGDILTPDPGASIVEVVTDEDWERYTGLVILDQAGTSARLERVPDPGLARVFALAKRGKDPLSRTWFALVDGVPQAYISSWPGNEGIGQVEDLFTHPDFRGQGLGQALLHHGVRDAREQGAGMIVIGADPSDWPKRWYAKMGWRPAGVVRGYWKEV